MMEIAPADLVRAAATAGYDSVGLRLVPTSDGIDHGVLGNAPRMAELRRLLDDTGVGLLDVEVVRLKPGGPGEIRPLLEAGAELGARHVICTMEDPEPERQVEVFASFDALASEYGLRANLEYMVFSAVPTLRAAHDLVTRAGVSAAILVDPLHHERGGGVPADVEGLPMSLLPYLQLCDASPAGRAADAVAARTEAVLGRLLPGDGALPLRELIALMDPTTGISVETPVAGQRRPEDPAAFAALALAATKRILG